MLKTRVIPSLLLHKGGLTKTIRFGKPRYVGDPINAIKIFNDKEVDELVVLDIDATRRGTIDFSLIARINKEAFMPLGYGGGIKSEKDVERVLSLGYEKVVMNAAARNDPDLITRAARLCGSQSVVICIDVKRTFLSRPAVFDYCSGKPTPMAPEEWARRVEVLGAGEILLYSVDRDGTYTGYDIPLIREVTRSVTIPVVALGGAGSLDDFEAGVFEGGAAGVSAGSMFVFHGPHRAVLITYPDKRELRKRLDRKGSAGGERPFSPGMP
jgi:imidazole glycerol-phosphate synthase subunit HisF